MFEQELYNAPPAEKSQEGDIFHNFEIRNWEYGPRIYKILAIALVFNLGALFIVAQTDVLTARGCESPWVGSVCQVLDMTYVSTVIYGTPPDYVDEDYVPTDLDDADVVFVDVTGETPPLSYPEGYFQIANPEEYAAMVAAQQQSSTSMYTTPMPTPLPSNDMMAQTPVYPTPNPSSVTGDIPDSPFSMGNSTASKKGRNRNRPGTNSNTNTDQTVAQTDANTNTNTSDPLTSDSVKEVEINKRPIADLGNYVNDLREKNLVNLESEFVVSAKGKLDKDGKLDPKTFRFVNTATKDEKMYEVVKSAVEAMNDAGYLRYLQTILGKEVAFTFQQDADNISATLQSDMESDSHAKTRKSSLDTLLGLWKLKKSNENSSQNEKDDLALLNGVQTEVKGKSLIIRFVVPKAIAHPMIQRKLAEQAAEKQKPSGSATTPPNNNNSLK